MTVLIDVLRHAKVWAPVRANHAAGSLVRDRLVSHWIGQALPLAVDAHIFGSIGRFAIRDRDSIAVRLPGAHRTSIEISTVTLAFSFGKEVLFEFLVG